jgi:hypothetical protein
MTRNTRLLLSSHAMRALVLIARSSLIPVMPPQSSAPEFNPYHQRRTGRNKGEKKRNKAVRWG